MLTGRYWEVERARKFGFGKEKPRCAMNPLSRLLTLVIGQNFRQHEEFKKELLDAGRVLSVETRVKCLLRAFSPGF